MQLKSLHISRQDKWQPNPGAFIGTVEFEDPKSQVAINLDDATAREIVVLCASGIVGAARQLSGHLLLTVRPEGRPE